MSELLIDSSEIIFTIDKPMISFHVNPKSNKDNLIQSQIIKYSPISECKIKITNLISKPIALRVRTTKKKNIMPSIQLIVLFFLIQIN